MKKLPVVLCLTLTILVWYFVALKPTSASWTTSRANNKYTGLSPYAAHDSPVVKWISSNVGNISGTPAVDPTGSIYLSADSKLVSFDKNGNKRWTFNLMIAPNSTPTLDSSNNLYFALSGCNPYVYSLTSGGVQRWRYDLRQGGGQCGWNQSNAAITLSSDEKTLYVGADYPLKALLFFNLDGSLQRTPVGLNSYYPGTSSVSLLDDNTLFVGSGGAGKLFSLDNSGTIKWQQVAGSGWTVTLSTPLIGPDNNLYVIAYGTNGGSLLVSYDVTGKKRWSYQLSNKNFTGIPVIKDNIIYTSIYEDDSLVAINTDSGTLVWQWSPTPSSNSMLFTPVVDKNGVIYTSLNDKLYAINPDGTTKWSLTLAPGLGSPIVADEDLIYVPRSSGSSGYLYAITTTPPPPPKNPIVFIPGIGGSEFKATQDIFWADHDNGHGGKYSHAYAKDEKIWVNQDEAVKLGDDDYFDILKLKTDGQTPEADLSLTGNLTSFGYGDIDTFFQGLGYIKNTNFFVFPYDWRKDIRTTATDLDNLIETAKNKAGTSQVNIVAHSMGGLVARNYIADSNKASKVGKLIELGVPHLGAVDSLKTLRYGSWLGYDFKIFEIGIPPSETKDNAQNFSSIFELIPSLKYYDFYNNSIGLPYPYKDDRDIDNNQVVGALNFNQTKILLSNLGHNITTFNIGEQFHSVSDPILNQANGVKIYEIIGTAQPTLGQIYETWWITWPINLIPKTDEIFINGDEIVPIYSASLKNENLDISGATKIYYVEQKHGDLVKINQPGMETVKAILAESDLPIEVKSEKFTLDGKHISVEDDDLDLYDEFGNHTGLKNSDEIETNIPGTSFSTTGTTKHAFVKKKSTKVKVKVTPKNKSKTNIKIRHYEQDQVIKTSVYKNIPAVESAPIEFNIDPTSPTSPTIPVGGQTFNPTSEATGSAALDQTPPTTKIELSGTKDDEGSYTSDVTITLTSADSESGISTIEYSLDNGQTVNIYTEPFIIDSEGSISLQVMSTDNIGNQELPQTITLSIDKPEVSSSATISTTPTLSFPSNTSNVLSSVSNDVSITNTPKVLAAIFKNPFQETKDTPLEPEVLGTLKKMSTFQKSNNYNDLEILLITAGGVIGVLSLALGLTFLKPSPK